MGDNRFKLRPGAKAGFQSRRAGAERNTLPWLFICDAFSFYQKAFIAVIDPKSRSKDLHPVATEEEFQLIVEGKRQRSSAEFDLDMIKYCQTECEVLSWLMVEMNKGLVTNKIRLRKDQFFGPGQVAQKMLVNMCRDNEATAFDRAAIEKQVPQDFRDAARASYYGGRFELFKHGMHEGTCYEYDINSAYPEVMTQLPCLLHGKYLSGKGSPYINYKERKTRPQMIDPFPRDKGRFKFQLGKVLCLVNATISGSNRRIGAGPHRNWAADMKATGTITTDR